MTTVFDRPHALKDVALHYCPGCTHGIIHRLVAQPSTSWASKDAAWASPPWDAAC